MEELLTYLKTCLKIRSEKEFYECEEFNSEIFESMVQDGIMVTKKPSDAVVPNSERITIGKYTIYKKCYRDLAWLAPSGEQEWDLSSEPLYRRLLPPPNETVNHTFIIQSVIKETNVFNTIYVEYGVRTGENLARVGPLVEKSIGIDFADPAIIAPNTTFYKTTTDVFSQVGLPLTNYYYAFIDADHKYESVIKDFENIYKYIQPGGYIFLHDTYPCMGELLLPVYCNDCYKTPIEIKKKYPSIEILTLPLNPGLTIVRKAQ